MSICIKQYYCIVSSAEKTQKVKKKKLQRQRKEEERFYQNVHFLIVKGQDFSKNKKPVDYYVV